MILANNEIAKFLISKFEEIIPLRRQKHPQGDGIDNWQESYGDLASLSFYFQQFEVLRCGQVLNNDEYSPLTNIPVLQTLKELEQALHVRDAQKIRTIVGCEDRHPLHMLAMISWYKIQETAEFACLADLLEDSHDHFSHQTPQYVQFISPIRRFMDIVVHRFVKAAIDGQQDPPYTYSEIRSICARVNRKYKLAKNYDKANRMLKIANLLRTPMYLPCFVESMDEYNIELTSPYIRHLKHEQKSL